MRRLPTYNVTHPDGRVVGYIWATTPGVVYLARCERSGLCKFGATVNPLNRLPVLFLQARKLYGRELRHVWSIITNRVGTAEQHWKRRWQPYLVGTAREWVELPDDEIRLFMSFGACDYKDAPPVPPDLREALSGLYAPRPRRRPA